MSDQENKARLEEERRGASSGEPPQGRAKSTKDVAEAIRTPQGKAKLALSFGKKLGKHWPILVSAVAFDVFALVPVLNFIFNFGFGLILYLWFGSEKKSEEVSVLKGIVLPIGLGSALDFILSALPVCFGAALFRIIMSNDEE